MCKLLVVVNLSDDLSVAGVTVPRRGKNDDSNLSVHLDSLAEFLAWIVMH